jgi:hypothetical protein
MLVEVKWFWVSIQMDICASEKLYPYKEVIIDILLFTQRF